MAFNPIQTVSKAAGERALGFGPGPIRAALAATITGAATAALTYRVLRSDSVGEALGTSGEDS